MAMYDANFGLFSNYNLAAGSNGTVAAHNSSIIDLGVGGTVIQKQVSGDASAGVLLVRPFRGNDPLQFELIVQATVTSGGAATVQFQLINSSDPALASGNTIIWDSGAIAKATLVAGYRPFQPNTGSTAVGAFSILKRYIGIIYTVGTAALTAGTLQSGFVQNLQTGPDFQN